MPCSWPTNLYNNNLSKTAMKSHGGLLCCTAAYRFIEQSVRWEGAAPLRRCTSSVRCADSFPKGQCRQLKQTSNIGSKDFAPAGATKGLSDRPLETFGPHVIGSWLVSIVFKLTTLPPKGKPLSLPPQSSGRDASLSAFLFIIQRHEKTGSS